MKMQQPELKESWWTKAILYSLGVFILISLSHFVYVVLVAKYCGLKDLGTLGDAIGGLTAPLINSITGLLVYFSFRQQLVANHTQATELQKQEVRIEADKKRSEDLASFDRTTVLINEAKDMLENFKVTLHLWDNTTGKSYDIDYKGSSAFEALKEAMDFREDPDKLLEESLRQIDDVLLDLNAIFLTLDFIAIQIQSFDENDQYRSILKIKFNNMFYKYREDIILTQVRAIRKKLGIYEFKFLELNKLISTFFDNID